MWLRLLSRSMTPPTGMLRRTFHGHQNKVNALTITPDGRHAVSGSLDDTINVWDLDTGQLIRTLNGHSRSVNAVAVTPDGRHIVSGSYDATIKVWDLDSGREIRSWSCHSERSSVQALAITPDGRGLVSGSEDHTLTLWDLVTGRELRTFSGHREGVTAVAITSDGRRVISTSGTDIFDSKENVIKEWDLDSGRELASTTGHGESIHAVAVTPDGKYAITGGGSRLYEQNKDTAIRVWDLRNWSLVRTLTGHGSRVSGLVVTPDGRQVVSASHDTTLRLWDLKSGVEIKRLQRHVFAVQAVALTPDGRSILSAGAHDYALKLWDLTADEAAPRQREHSGHVSAVAVAPDGAHFISVSEDGTIKLWDLAKQSVIKTIRTEEELRAVAIEPVHGRYAITGAGCADDIQSTSHARVWDMAAWREVADLGEYSAPVNSVAISPDCRYVALGIGNWMFAALEPSQVVVHDRTNRTAMTLAGHRSCVNAVAITPDGRYVLSGSGDSVGGGECAIKLWEMARKVEISSISTSTAVTAITPHPDGRYVAVGTTSSVYIWDFLSGSGLQTLTDDRGSEALAFALDGTFLVSTSRANVRVWSMATKDLEAEFSGDSPFYCCAVATDGATIIVGDVTGLVLFLRLEQSEQAHSHRDSPLRPIDASDGSSLAAAVSVDDVAGEYHWVARNCGRFKAVAQHVLEFDGRWFDVLTLRSDDGVERQVYFDVSRFFRPYE